VTWIDTAFGFVLGFLVGFFLASWAAYKAKIRARASMSKATSAIRTEVLRLLETLKDVSEVKITIVEDDAGDVELKIDEKTKDPITRH
jgi:hypothetical protein